MNVVNLSNVNTITVNTMDCQKVKIIKNGVETQVWEKDIPPINPNLLNAEYFASEIINVFGGKLNADGSYGWSCNKAGSLQILSNIQFEPNTSYKFSFYGKCQNANALYTNLKIYFSDGSSLAPAFTVKGDYSYAELITSPSKTVSSINANYGSYGTDMMVEQCSITKVI